MPVNSPRSENEEHEKNNNDKNTYRAFPKMCKEIPKTCKGKEPPEVPPAL